MTDNEVREIAIRLDPPGVVSKNWHDLAYYLGFDELERAAFKRAYCGGGSPALNFFISLKVFRKKNVDDSSIALIIPPALLIIYSAKFPQPCYIP